MNEAEWLNSHDPRAMLQDVGNTASERMLLLFCVACCRAIGAPHPDRDGPIIEAVERYADGIGSEAEVIRAVRAYDSDYCLAHRIAQFFEIRGHGYDLSLHLHAAGVTNTASWIGLGQGGSELERGAEIGRRAREQAALLRDIIGYPFRPVAFDPAWRTSNAVALAAQMYESRDFSAMPILADALQDAGCETAEILDHCRSAGPHVRGCWVVDFVLARG